jgi:hypothetical protein
MPMPNSFEDRQKALENKAKMDEEALFKLNAKAVKLFGLWAAGQLGLRGTEASAYADEVVDSDFDEPGIQDVLRKVKKDFDAKGIDANLNHLEKQFNRHLDEARKQ